jgi:MFS transporter, SP family, sugar:H+ symporter
MMAQQWTGINFIFYFGTVYFKDAFDIHPYFLLTTVINAINVGCTALSFVLIEKVGRRKMLVIGALSMALCELLIGTMFSFNTGVHAQHALVTFGCMYIAIFAISWGPISWVSYPIGGAGVQTSAQHSNSPQSDAITC